MTDRIPTPTEIDTAIRERVLTRVQAITSGLAARLMTATADLEAGNHLAALGGLDGIESEVANARSFLLLLR